MNVGIDISKLSVQERLAYLETCLAILPTTKERIITEEDYKAYKEVLHKKRSNCTGIFTQSKLDIACGDSDVLEYTEMLLNELRDRMRQELLDSDDL